MIHYLPIENIEQRYTKLMNDIVYPHCDYIYYPTDFNHVEIKKGQFLDIERTIQFKARQLELVSLAFQEGKIKSGDWFLVADIYFPGIESIKYMAELQDIQVKIASFNHAGRADENDFVQKLKGWSDHTEKGYHAVCDKIFVGSEYHKKNVDNYFKMPKGKVIATGIVWDMDVARKIYPYADIKEEFVIWPHRICTEKGFDEFMSIAIDYPEYQYVITSSSKINTYHHLPKNVEYIYGLSKSEYYQYMSKAKYYLSTAHQETFGYTLREAIMYDCRIAVPDRACYKEMVPFINRYTDISEIPAIFNLNPLTDHKEDFNNNIRHIIKHLI